MGPTISSVVVVIDADGTVEGALEDSVDANGGSIGIGCVLGAASESSASGTRLSEQPGHKSSVNAKIPKKRTSSDE